MKFFKNNPYLVWIVALFFLLLIYFGYVILYLPNGLTTIFLFANLLLPLVLLIYLAQFINQRLIKTLSVVLVLVYLAELFVVIYRIATHYSFNFFYFWYNLSEIIPTLLNTFVNFWLFIVLFIFFSFILYQTFFNIAVDFKQKKNRILLGIIILVVVVSVINCRFFQVKLELIKVITESWQMDTAVAKLYNQYYWQVIDDFSQYNQAQLQNNQEITETNQNIFFIHLESLNSSLISEKITPAFLDTTNASGVVFPKLQTNNIQTLRSEENILCSVLPSIRQTLHHYDIADQLVCLPKLLKSLGYKALFFKSHDLSFADTGNFMLSLGFDEVHNADIMSPEDELLPWGYREDIFYQRVLEYLQKYQDEKLFVYIAVSTTNHLPFDAKDVNYSDFHDILPYPQPTSFKERISNTTFLQDHFFGQLFKQWKISYQADSQMFVFGDQAWPIGEHDNYHNEINAWQENFLSSLAIIPATNQAVDFSTQSIRQEYVSQNDIMPTVLDLLNIQGFQTAGTSLLTLNPQSDKCIISVQPYSRVYLSVLKSPIKHIYDILDNQVTVYNLDNDPEEKNPIQIGPIEDLTWLEDCLKSILAGGVN